MQVEIGESFDIVGVLTRTSNAAGKGEADIPALWGRFWGEGITQKLTDRENDTVYAVYTNYESDYTGEYDAIIGYRMKTGYGALPPGLSSVTIQHGRYEKFTASGNIMQGIVFEKWMEIWQSPVNRGYTADFEVYDDRSADTANATVDIFIALKS